MFYVLKCWVYAKDRSLLNSEFAIPGVYSHGRVESLDHGPTKTEPFFVFTSLCKLIFWAK